MEQDPIKIRAHAAMLRRRFEGHTNTVRNIVADLSDIQLIAEDEFFHQDKLVRKQMEGLE